MDPEKNPEPSDQERSLSTYWLPRFAPYESRRNIHPKLKLIEPIPMPPSPPPPTPLPPSAPAFHAMPPHIPKPLHRLDRSTYVALPKYRPDSTAPKLFPGNTPSGGSQNMTASSAGDMTTSAMPSSNASSYLYLPGLSPSLISTQSAAPPAAWSVQQQAPRQFSGQENRDGSQCLMSNPPLVKNESPELEAVTSSSSQESSPDYCPIDPIETQPPPNVPFTTTTSSLTVPSNDSSYFKASPASTTSEMVLLRSLHDFRPLHTRQLCIGSPASTSLQMGQQLSPHQSKMQLTKSLHLIPPPAPHSYQYSPLCSLSASNGLVDKLPAQPTPGNEAKPQPGQDLLSDVSLLVSRGSSGGSSNETAMCLPQAPYIWPIPRDPDTTITMSTAAKVDNANMPPEGLEYTTMNTAVATDNLRSCPEGPLQNQFTLMLPSEQSIKFSKGLAEDPQSNSHDGLKKPSMFKKSLGGQPEKQALCAKNWGILKSDSSGSASALRDQGLMSSDIVTHLSVGYDSANAVFKPEAQQSSTSYSSLANPMAVIVPLGNQPHDWDALEIMQTKIYPKLHFNPMEEKVTITQPHDLTMVSNETTDQCTAKSKQKSTKAALGQRLNSCMPSYSSHSSLPFKGCATKSASLSFSTICQKTLKDFNFQTESKAWKEYSSSRQERGTEKGSKDSLLCEICGLAFSSMNKLSRHQHQFHSSNFSEVPTGVHIMELSLDSPLSSFSISGTASITSEATSQFSITPTISFTGPIPSSGPIPSMVDMGWVETPSTSCNQPCPPVCQSSNKNLPTYNSEDCEKDNDVSNESKPDFSLGKRQRNLMNSERPMKQKSAIQQSPHGQRELVLTCQDNSSSGYGQPAAPEPPKTKATATIIAASERRIAPQYLYQSPPAVPGSSNAELHHEQDKCPNSNADPEQDKFQVNIRNKKRTRFNSKILCPYCCLSFSAKSELMHHTEERHLNINGFRYNTRSTQARVSKST